MLELLAILAGVAVFPLGLGLMWMRLEPAPAEPGRQLLDTGPAEPCWTEEVGRDGALSLRRGECVHDMLIELDARAARGDFPVKELNETRC
ncbi:MAG: hypothetical protein E6G92_13360 [Alphaproteobacteria bacterium]|nr:MAG: hypothetical protein E6G92_13360 [Alphaproteobacteria bacterium]